MRVGRPLSIVLALAASCASAAWAIPTTPARGVLPVVVRPESSRLAPHEPQSVEEREIGIGRERGEAHYRALKLRGAEPVRLGGREHFEDPTRVAPEAAQVLSTFSGLPQYYSVPYDAAIAASPTQVLVMTNNQFAVYAKDTGARLSTGLYNTFWGVAAGGGCDPKCFYDAAAGRFVMIVIEVANNPNRALLDIAVSQTGDASGAWYRYSYDATLTNSTPSNTWSDFPGLGYNDRNVYVATNQFSFTNYFQFAKLRCWSKQELYSGVQAGYVDFAGIRNADGSSAFAIKPARNLVPSTVGHFFATRPSGGSSVSIWTVTGTYPNLTLSPASTVAVGSYSVGPDARQPGTSVLIDTGDCRTQDVVWQGGTYYTAFTEKSGKGRSIVTAARYLEVSDAARATRDATYAASGIWLYYPAVSVDPAGNAALVFERSSSTEYVSAYQTRMPAGGSLEASQRVNAGVAPNTRGRWGDYNGVANDPADPTRVWIYGGYGNTNNQWATWIASLEPSVAGSAPAMVALAEATADEDARATLSGDAPVGRDFRVSLAPGRASLAFELDQPGRVRLAVFDLGGRRVRTIADRRFESGSQVVEWDGRAEDGRRAGAGVYWARLEAGSASIARRVTLVE